jgi:hypothetical protein
VIGRGYFRVESFCIWPRRQARTQTDIVAMALVWVSIFLLTLCLCSCLLIKAFETNNRMGVPFLKAPQDTREAFGF